MGCIGKPLCNELCLYVLWHRHCYWCASLDQANCLKILSLKLRFYWGQVYLDNILHYVLFHYHCCLCSICHAVLPLSHCCMNHAKLIKSSFGYRNHYREHLVVFHQGFQLKTNLHIRDNLAFGKYVLCQKYVRAQSVKQCIHTRPEIVNIQAPHVLVSARDYILLNWFDSTCNSCMQYNPIYSTAKIPICMPNPFAYNH